MASLFEIINSIPLDPRSELDLVSEAKLVAFNKSNGALNDFSAGSPLAALIEAQAFVGSELLFYANKAIPSLAIEFYKNVGVQRRLGTPSVVTLTFELQSSQLTPFYIPQFFEVSDINNSVYFKTNNSVVIPPGQTSITVTATSSSIGSNQNVKALSITNITQSLTNLNLVKNLVSAQGGSDKETLEETIVRGNLALRTRGLVSADDYERTAEALIGKGSRFKAVGNLGSNKIDYVLGTVHLFGLDVSGNPITPAQAYTVVTNLTPNIHISTSLFCSSVELKNVDVDVEFIISPSSTLSAAQVAANVYLNLYNYMSSKYFQIGEDLLIEEVEYIVRDTDNVKRGRSIELDNATNDITITNNYSVINLSQATIKVFDEVGVNLFTNTFVGEPN